MSALGAVVGRRRWLVLAVALTVLAAALLALAPLGRPGQPVADPAPAQAQGGEGAEPPAWDPCGDGFDCASYPVPVDHADPFGPQMRLALMRLPATGPPDQKVGSLFLNPGGPGGSALDFLATYSSRFSEEVRARFDIVAFNPRGVTGSSPEIHCERLDPPVPDPGDWSGYFGALLEPLGVASTACQLAIARTGPYYGTNQVVQDLDLLRSAVGDDELNYWGISYGTRIGELYAQLYPDRVRAMILDGNVDPHSTALTFTSQRGGSFDDAFDFFLSTYPGLEAAFAQVSGALAAGPVEVIDLTTGEPRSLTLQAFYTQSIMALLPTEQLWPTLAAEILAMSNQLLGGPMASVMVHEGTANMATVGIQVNCLDLPQRPSLEVMSVTAAEMVAEGPLFGEYVASTLPACDGFAIPPDPVPANPPGSGLPPVLLFASAHDPATPYPWSSAMLSFLPGSARVTYGGVQHGVWNGPSECIDAVGDAYMIELRLPTAGIECPFVKPAPLDPSGAGGS